MNPLETRMKIRRQEMTGTTSGLCEQYIQTNMVTLPKAYAFDFLLFCMRNPKPCPIVEVMEAGMSRPAAADADIRTDLPRYRIYRNGSFSEEVLHLNDVWQDDFVTFLIGCSFTFEKALLDGGIPLLHQEQNKVVPMFDTNIPLQEAGIFKGNMVVSMRAVPNHLVDQALAVSHDFESSHGEPVHTGAPEEIGITDLQKPDYGEAVTFDTDEMTPLFWACGVTPQNAALQARPSIMITHAPGHMLITDKKDPNYSIDS
ncbi:putative hydro-lyase [Halobacillus halophilus]|uniref:putative hydro-lyase n=1 Tax=Halobacillus halophilus TaxID=1570 RepID=UPI00136B415C|nr:putative hydro-lyase [Halobacillus halophilus]MYL28758.1 putative hydro-lyase [Halobacillus halophilus]